MMSDLKGEERSRLMEELQVQGFANEGLDSESFLIYPEYKSVSSLRKKM